MADNKRIAKNTIFLYIRMFIIMGVTLYTSRVVLDKLGVDDFALYNVVGGVVGMLSFLNGTLSIGTSRFLTYELGTGNKQRLIETFNTAFYTHVVLAVIIILLMETGGLWFMYNKLVIPPDRIDACFWVLQISILTTVISITQVPYSASIMAYERMGIYAYVSIFEALGKLGVCYALNITELDKLIVYASLLAVVQLSVALYYRLYCVRTFDSCKLSLSFNRDILKGLLGFSSWNIMANVAEMLKLQGILMIVNIFLSPVIVAAQALSNQVSTALMQFINNFRTAINPQIIKLYAAGDKEASKKLTIQTTVYCFDLTLLLALPCIYTMKTLMGIWLVDVPEYAVVFAQIVFAGHIAGSFGASFYTPMLAANKIKTNSVAGVICGFISFILLFIALKFEGNPLWVPSISILVFICLVLIIKPYILVKDVGYTWKEIIKCYIDSIKVLTLSVALSFPASYLSDGSLIQEIGVFFWTIISVCLSSYLFMPKETRIKLVSLVKNKIHYK